MKSIQRYALATTTCAESGEVHPYMERCKDGLYVSHADHVREVAALREACGGLIDFLERYPHQFAVDISGHEAALRAALQSGKEE